MFRNKIIIAALAIPFLVACGKSFVKEEPGSEKVTIADSIDQNRPGDAGAGETIHIICEVTDAGSPRLTRYQRVVLTVQP